MSDASNLSRPTSLGLGKCTASLRALVPEELKEEFVKRSRGMGYASESDCLRDLIALWLLGPEEIAKVQAERIRRLTITGSEAVR